MRTSTLDLCGGYLILLHKLFLLNYTNAIKLLLSIDILYFILAFLVILDYEAVNYNASYRSQKQLSLFHCSRTYI